MQLSKDGITVDVNKEDDIQRFRALGYVGEGETPLNTIEDYKKQADKVFNNLEKKNKKLEKELKEATAELNKLKKTSSPKSQLGL